MMSGMGGMVMSGMALGAGSAVGHAAVNSMMGTGRSSGGGEAQQQQPQQMQQEGQQQQYAQQEQAQQQ